MSEITKVMGPDAPSSIASFLSPPKLTAETDKFQWRNDVKTWSQIIKSYAKGGDGRCKGMLNALGLTLYFSLEQDQRSLIDDAVRSQQLTLHNDDEDESPEATAKCQLRVVDDIVQLVAKDSPTDGIRRLVKISQDIYHCVRNNTEKPYIFARKFQGLAKRYLNMCNSSNTTHDSQNFAILMLENAKLPSSTFNNIVTQLVTRSVSATHNVTNASVNVPISTFTRMLEVNAETAAAITAFEASVGTSVQREELQDLVSKSRNLINIVKTTTTDLRKTADESKDRSRPGFTITLDDAVEALCDIKADDESPTVNTQVAEIKKKLESEIKKGTMMAKRKEYKDGERQPSAKKSKVYIPAGTGVKKDSICNSCKEKGHWKVKGSVTLQTDPNPIIDEGAPSSTGGINNAAALCDLLGIQLILDAPREHYEHGWGEECHDARPIIASWTLTVMDNSNHPVSLTFDLVRGDSPLIIGLDVMEHADIINTVTPRHIKIRRPHDVKSLSLLTYITHEGALGRTKRLRVEIIPHAKSTVASLMSNISMLGNRTPLAFSKKIHRFTHAPADEVKNICENAGILNEELSKAIDTIDAECEVCAKNGRPANMRKISLTYVNAAFNEELQIDFTHCTIRETRHVLLNMTDRGTGWSEMRIVQNQNLHTMKTIVERDWICHHGAPKAVSGDDAYDKADFRNFLKQHRISYKPRPARRHNKLGAVERKNGTIKAIIRKLDSDLTDADAETIVARAVFLSNLFSGSRKMSSFQLAKGYTPSVVGIPSSRVTPELLQAHKEQTATRALHTLLHSNNCNVVMSDVLKKDDPIWVYYETSSKAKKKGWVKASVVEAQQHRVLARRSAKGPPLRVAYEDVRIAPTSQLTQDLMSRSLEEELESEEHHVEAESAQVGRDLSDRGVERDSEANRPTRNMSETLPSDITRNTNNETSTAAEDPTDAQHTATLMAQQRSASEENAIADIGKAELTNIPPKYAVLQSDRARIMETISGTIGKEQVNRGKLEFAPSWIIQEAFDEEYTSNWQDAYDEMEECEVPANANVISSHVVYKVKTSEDGSKSLKARIVPHGNRDSEKENVRKDSSTAQFDVIRLLLTVTTLLGLRLAMADIKGAYLQSGPIRREIYVRPPREWKGSRGKLWKLKKLPYGIVEAGRQWAKTIEEWMLTKGGLQRLPGLSQMYVRRNEKGTITLIVAKVTDDFICGGSVQTTTKFIEDMGKRFSIGKRMIDKRFLFNGCEIEQDKWGSIKMSMEGYMSQLNEIPVSQERRKQQNEKATSREITQFRSLAGTLLWLGKGVLPPAAYASSTMQQKLANLKVGHLVEANDIVRDVKKLKPYIMYNRPDHATRAIVSTLSDASFNISSRKSYGQTGLILGIRTLTRDGTEYFHMLDWVSTKQRRICHSSYGAEILACAEGDDRGFYIKMGMRALFPAAKMRNELVVDSQGLFDTITTLHESSEYRLRQTVQRIRDSFEAGDIDILRWIPGIYNIADALTKRNIVLWRKLNNMSITGYLDPDLLRGQRLDSADWK